MTTPVEIWIPLDTHFGPSKYGRLKYGRGKYGKGQQQTVWSPITNPSESWAPIPAQTDNWVGAV